MNVPTVGKYRQAEWCYYYMDISEMYDLTGKVALVTGAGNGIGRGCALVLAAAGAAVVVTDRSQESADAVAAEIVAADGKAVGMACDVMNDADLVAAVNMASSTFGALNILVNNAGMGGGGRENPFKIDVAYLERIYRINLFAPWRLCQLAVPLMQKSGYGSIINISSMSSQDKEANMGVYASSKAALNHMSANLAYDFGPMGVRINCVGPGATRTAALAKVLTPELEEAMLRHTPLKRLGKVDDMARAVLFFASPASSWVSGQVLFVNGGGNQTLD